MSHDRGYPGYLSQAATLWPSRVGLRFEGRCWTYAELQGAAQAAAGRLAAAGIGAGTRVALLVDNRPEYLIAQFALARLGATFVTPNPYWTPVEVDQALAAAAVTASVHTGRFSDVAAQLHTTVPVNTLFDGAADAPPAADPAPHTPLYIPFSSGTTGLPKGVVHTTESLCGGVE